MLIIKHQDQPANFPGLDARGLAHTLEPTPVILNEGGEREDPRARREKGERERERFSYEHPLTDDI